jgi:DNA primase
LSRFTKRVVINYDGDSAGIKAARRAIEELLPQDFDIKVLVLPDGQDPDDFIRENGPDAYNEARGKAKSFLPFLLDRIDDRSFAPRTPSTRQTPSKKRCPCWRPSEIPIQKAAEL